MPPNDSVFANALDAYGGGKNILSPRDLRDRASLRVVVLVIAARVINLYVCRSNRQAMHNTELADPMFSMNQAAPRQFFIQGTTLDGRTFRPSDWAERLAGAMSAFRPGGMRGGGGIGAFIGYSPYCVPRLINGIKCVIVDERLRSLEPMAWDFVMNFARDNQLQVTEACLLPDGTMRPTAPS